MNPWRPGIDIRYRRGDIDGGGFALVVEPEEIDDLQAGCAIRDKGDASAKRDAERVGGQYEPRQEPVGVERVGKVHYVQSQRHSPTTTRAAYGDAQPGAICDYRLTGNGVVIHAAEQR